MLPVASHLRRVLVVAALATLLVLSLYDGVMAYRMERMHTEADAGSKLNAMARKLVAVTLHDDPRDERQLVEQLEAFPEFGSLAVFDGELAMRFEYHRADIPVGQMTRWDEIEPMLPAGISPGEGLAIRHAADPSHAAGSSMIGSWNAQPVLMLVRPLLWEGVEYGTIVLHTELPLLRHWLGRLLPDLLAVTLLLAVVVLVVNRSLQRLIIRPLAATADFVGTADTLRSTAPMRVDSRAREIRQLQTGINGMLGTFAEQDRRQQRLYEESARNESLRTAIVKASFDGVITIDAQGMILDFNPAACRITGFAEQDVLGRSFIEVLVPEPRRHRYLEALHRDSSRSNDQGDDPWVWRARRTVLNVSGDEVPVEVSVQSFVLLGSRYTTFFICDIRDRIRREEAIAEARRREQLQFDNLATPAMVWRRADGGYLLESCNPAASEFTGGLDIEVSSIEPLLAAFPAMGELFERAGTEGILSRGEVVSADDASDRKIHLSVTCTRLEEGLVMLQMMDITDLREGQQLIVQATKMATLGEMATQVAHEMNQPLHLIRMSANNIRRVVSREPIDMEKLHGKLDRVLGAVDRASGIVERMRIFRGAQGRPAPFDLVALVRSAVERQQDRFAREGIEVTVDHHDLEVTIDTSQALFDQLLHNLLDNAITALAPVQDRRRQLRLVIEASGEATCRLSVIDNGVGIDPQILDRMFEPFVSSHPMGERSRLGLGLSLCYGVIHDLGGTIRAANGEPGARIELTIPCRFEHYTESLIA